MAVETASFSGILVLVGLSSPCTLSAWGLITHCSGLWSLVSFTCIALLSSCSGCLPRLPCDEMIDVSLFCSRQDGGQSDGQWNKTQLKVTKCTLSTCVCGAKFQTRFLFIVSLMIRLVGHQVVEFHEAANVSLERRQIPLFLFASSMAMISSILEMASLLFLAPIEKEGQTIWHSFRTELGKVCVKSCQCRYCGCKYLPMRASMEPEPTPAFLEGLGYKTA